MTESKKVSKEIKKKSATAKKTTSKAAGKAPEKKRNATKRVDKIKSQTKTKPFKEPSEEKSFIMGAAKNIEFGTKVVGEEATEIAYKIAQKTSDLTGKIFKKVKKGVSEAYDFGAKAVESINETAQDYAEKYKHKVEIHKLKFEQDELYTKLGSVTFEKHYVSGIPADQLFNEEKIKELVNQIKKNAKQIVKLGKELDKSE